MKRAVTCSGCSLCCPGCAADRHPEYYPDSAPHNCDGGLGLDTWDDEAGMTELQKRMFE